MGNKITQKTESPTLILAQRLKKLNKGSQTASP